MQYLGFGLLITILTLNNFIFAFADSLQSDVLLAEKIKNQDATIAITFKFLAKLFIAVTDMDDLKKNNIERLNKIDEERFEKEYSDVYRILKDCPVLMAHYRIKENMTKQEVLEQIKALDKNKVYEIIDSIPDRVIAEQFRQYLNKKNQGIQENEITKQVNRFWSNIITKALAKE